jgi:hypothetical protein
MATNTTAKSRISEELKNNLFSENTAVVMQALNKCMDIGNWEMVEPLLALYAKTNEVVVKNQIGQMLSELKVSNVEPSFANALMNPGMAHIHKDILGFMWSSGVQATGSVGLITKVAISGSYETALEALTLIESLDDEIPEEILLESTTDLKQHLGQATLNDKTKLLMELLKVIEAKEISE